MRLSVGHVAQSWAVHSVVPVGASGTAPVVIGDGAGAGLGAGAGAAGAIAAGVEAGAGAAFGATLRTGGRFFGFAVLAAVRLGARLAMTFFLVARFFGRAIDFSTRFFVFALLFDFALLFGLADRFVFAFLAMRVAPLLWSLYRTDSSGHAANLRDPLKQARYGTSYGWPGTPRVGAQGALRCLASAFAGGLHRDMKKWSRVRRLRRISASPGSGRVHGYCPVAGLERRSLRTAGPRDHRGGRMIEAVALGRSHHAVEERDPVAAGGAQHEAVPDSVVVGQPPPQVEHDAEAVEQAANGEQGDSGQGHSGE